MHSRILLSSLAIASLVFYVSLLRPRSGWVESYVSLVSSEQGEGTESAHLSTLANGDERLGDVFNDTLGFQEVFMISLPSRSDKRDAFTMGARLSNISFTLIDGVDGKKVPQNALPYTFDQNAGATGCWRAHLNIFQEMVHSNIQSALIFEDDADWDVALKYQMKELARGSRWLTNQSEEVTPLSPYGDNWDVLWIGHCSTGPDDTDNRRWVIPHDPTVLPQDMRWEWEKPDMSPWDVAGSDNQTRLAYVADWCSCTAAYAISLSGAEKVLFNMSMNPYNLPIDNGMGEMCRSKTLDFSCVSTFPTLVGTSTAAGGKNKESDINKWSKEEETFEETSHSWRVMFPVRQNIQRLLRGQTVFESQCPGITGDEMELSEIGSAVGHPEWLEWDTMWTHEKERQKEEEDRQKEEEAKQQEEEDRLAEEKEFEEAEERQQKKGSKNKQDAEETR